MDRNRNGSGLLSIVIFIAIMGLLCLLLVFGKSELNNKRDNKAQAIVFHDDYTKFSRYTYVRNR